MEEFLLRLLEAIAVVAARTGTLTGALVAALALGALVYARTRGPKQDRDVAEAIELERTNPAGAAHIRALLADPHPDPSAVGTAIVQLRASGLHALADTLERSTLAKQGNR